MLAEALAANLLGIASALVLGACSVNIGSETDAAPATTSAAPALSGCMPLRDVATAVTGRVSELTLPDQSSLVIAASATLDGTSNSAAFSGADTTCLAGSTPLASRPIIDPSGLGANINPRPLASVSVGSAVFLYFSADHSDGLASDGFGIATYDAAGQRFVALPLLWTSDRPSYGSAAALVDDDVYVFGGLSARYLSADVYLARVPSAQIVNQSAYEYWQGAGVFGANPDGAMPLVEGGTEPSVAFDSTRARWLMLYATPLASDVTVRSGLGVTGPWSAPQTLGHCVLPASDSSSFCGALALVPELAAAGDLAFTQGVASFARPANATDADFWTRLVRAPWPNELP
jgi:hypothetical protein